MNRRCRPEHGIWQGLRTLAIGTRVLEEDFYTEWDEGYQEAAALLDGRDDAIDEQVSAVEADVELVGVTAIEDKLQEGVPAAIQTLLDAGMKVLLCAACSWTPLILVLIEWISILNVSSVACSSFSFTLVMPLLIAVLTAAHSISDFEMKGRRLLELRCISDCTWTAERCRDDMVRRCG